MHTRILTQGLEEETLPNESACLKAAQALLIWLLVKA